MTIMMIFDVIHIVGINNHIAIVIACIVDIITIIIVVVVVFSVVVFAVNIILSSLLL